MGRAKAKRPRKTPTGAKRQASRKPKSFRFLKAFGMWADRDDIKDTVEFVTRLRKRMEHGNAAR